MRISDGAGVLKIGARSIERFREVSAGEVDLMAVQVPSSEELLIGSKAAFRGVCSGLLSEFVPRMLSLK